MATNFYVVCFMTIAGILRLNFRKVQKVFELTWTACTSGLRKPCPRLIELDIKHISSYIFCT